MNTPAVIELRSGVYDSRILALVQLLQLVVILKMIGLFDAPDVR